tara:strand:- start:650 stop:1189 length:540 start_codon:yes stop_codon:yes gene_type:complete
MSEYDFAFEQVIGHEGGYTNRRSDPGNWTGGRIGSGILKGTKYGISAGSYPQLDIRSLTIEDAKQIYYRDYFISSGAALCPPGLSLAVFDAGVNTGNSRARRWLQLAVGVAADGVIGPKTKAAIDDRTARNPLGVLKEFQAQRTWHHMKLDSMDDEYGLGWSRRIIDVTITAVDRIKKR